VESSDRNLNTLLSLATAIKPEWLEELFPGDIQATTGVDYDPSSRRVIAEMQKRFRGLALDGKRVEPPPADEAAKLLAQEVLEGRLVLTRWDHEVEQWIERLNQLSTWCPELALPPMSDEDRAVLIEQICHGSFSYKDIKEKEIKPVVKSWLSHAQQELLEKHAPERIPLPNGKKGKVTYSRESMPYLAVKIQDLYGMTQTPRIAMNRVALIVHILGPNMRPVQITQDLAGFWKEHYPRIKQELQRKYPKHEWK
jgi:ATP-dependent helicase HrpB